MDWIDVETKLPESAHGGWVEVLVLDEGIVSASDYWIDEKEFWPANGKGEYWADKYHNVTHWMPFPKAPI